MALLDYLRVVLLKARHVLKIKYSETSGNNKYKMWYVTINTSIKPKFLKLFGKCFQLAFFQSLHMYENYRNVNERKYIMCFENNMLRLHQR